ncbi:MAG: hypothetical protein R2712_11135 [Vicinamibacterales bacterium]
MLIGPAPVLALLRRQLEPNPDIQSFTEHEVREAVEYIATAKPPVVALDEEFAVIREVKPSSAASPTIRIWRPARSAFWPGSLTRNPHGTKSRTSRPSQRCQWTRAAPRPRRHSIDMARGARNASASPRAWRSPWTAVRRSSWICPAAVHRCCRRWCCGRTSTSGWPCGSHPRHPLRRHRRLGHVRDAAGPAPRYRAGLKISGIDAAILEEFAVRHRAAAHSGQPD